MACCFRWFLCWLWCHVILRKRFLSNLFATCQIYVKAFPAHQRRKTSIQRPCWCLLYSRCLWKDQLDLRSSTGSKSLAPYRCLHPMERTLQPCLHFSRLFLGSWDHYQLLFVNRCSLHSIVKQFAARDGRSSFCTPRGTPQVLRFQLFECQARLRNFLPLVFWRQRPARVESKASLWSHRVLAWALSIPFCALVCSSGARCWA